MKKILFISFAFLLTFAFTVESFLNVTKAEEKSSEDYGELKQEGVFYSSSLIANLLFSYFTFP